MIASLETQFVDYKKQNAFYCAFEKIDLNVNDKLLLSLIWQLKCEATKIESGTEQAVKNGIFTKQNEVHYERLAQILHSETD